MSVEKSLATIYVVKRERNKSLTVLYGTGNYVCENKNVWTEQSLVNLIYTHSNKPLSHLCPAF